MNDNYSTEQENFWAGDFGNEYVLRSQGTEILNSNISFFKSALKNTNNIKTCIEFGSNIGMNIKALQKLFPNQEQHAIEINKDAVSYLKKVIPEGNIINDSIINFKPFKKWDLVLIKGVLIHINPEMLQKVYLSLVNACSKYLLINEYYNPKPVTIDYRGHDERLFKRDFAGEILDTFPEMKLIDYGFLYERDPVHKRVGSTNWFLLEKN
tara:strand:- start:697 stop:1326 length:630 start_codon:yes stop_codon:yes gene_type:complete